MPPLALLIASATILVNVDRVEDVSVTEANDIAGRLAVWIERVTGQVAVPRTAPTGECSDNEAKCIQAAKAATGADEVVIVRIYRAVTTTALFARRPNGARAEATIRVGDTKIDDHLRAVALQLFPNRMDQPAAPAPGVAAVALEAPTDARPSRVGPVLAGLIGVGLGAASLGLYLQAGSTITNADARIMDATIGDRVVGLDYDRVAAEYSSAGQQRTVALGLVIGGVVALATGGLWWWLTEPAPDPTPRSDAQ